MSTAPTLSEDGPDPAGAPGFAELGADESPYFNRELSWLQFNQRVLAQALDGEVLHYRDDYGVEVDTIVQLRDGRWGAIEIKLGPPLQRLPRPFSCKRHWLVLEVGDGAQLRVSRDQRQEAGLGRLNPAPNGIPGHPRPLDPRSVLSG